MAGRTAKTPNSNFMTKAVIAAAEAKNIDCQE